jgi:hypothetical protein
VHGGVPFLSNLVARQDALLKQLRNAGWIHRRDAAKERFRVADEAAIPDYVVIGKLGTALKAVVAEGAQPALSEADYLSLKIRHSAVVQETEEMCAALVQAGAYEELAVQASTLRELWTTWLLLDDPSEADSVSGGDNPNGIDLDALLRDSSVDEDDL